MSCKTIICENRAYWTQRAATYSQDNQAELADSHKQAWRSVITEQIAAHFPNRQNGDIRILEVGTGPGFFAIILAEAGYRVTAIDLTPSMLLEARKNAGFLADRIDFREMNAEDLTFEDGCFDVIVTRNLTWNLPHPENGYAQWCRVLKKGGMLLNFDANWYSYLFDAQAQAAFQYDRDHTAAQGYRDLNVGENFDIMEDIARRIPLSSIMRPAWDLNVLHRLGMEATADPSIWQRVWSETEKSSFASTPMFMIRAIRK